MPSLFSDDPIESMETAKQIIGGHIKADHDELAKIAQDKALKKWTLISAIYTLGFLGDEKFLPILRDILAGAINSMLLVGSPRAMLGTPYGRLLMLKILLFLAMVVVALANRFHLAPRIGRDAVALGALCRTVSLEQGLGVCVLVVVSFLGTWAPA
jgi:hypothetical protein